MNNTVKRIVDLLFGNEDENEEVKALHEELQNNCQEHFDDLIGRGLSEDEAIAEIVTSLKGMEDVIKEARGDKAEKKESGEETETKQNAPECNDMVFAAEPVRVIRVESSGFDVRVEVSPDDQIHVINELKDGARLNATRNEDVLRIYGDAKEEHIEKPSFFQTTENGFNFDLKSFGNFMKSLGRTLDSAIRGCSGTAVVLVPAAGVPEIQVNSKSGDISLNGVPAAAIDLGTASGDISVVCTAENKCGRIKMSSASGDLKGTIQAEKLDVSTISGDVDLEGFATSVNARSTSGDVEVNMVAEQVNSASVSGDVDLDLHGAVQGVQVNTTSGDVTVNLPTELSVQTRLKTVSGDLAVLRDVQENGETTVTVNTVSGDIRIQ